MNTLEAILNTHKKAKTFYDDEWLTVRTVDTSLWMSYYPDGVPEFHASLEDITAAQELIWMAA